MKLPRGAGEGRSIALALVMLVLAVGLFGGLGRLQSARVRYNAMAHAAGHMTTTATALGSLKWEVMAEGDAERDEVDEARSMIAAVHADLALIGSLPNAASADEVIAMWHRYSRGVMDLLKLVQDGDMIAADVFEEDILEPREEALSALIESVRVEAVALDARAERLEAFGSTVLIIGALAGFLAALTLSQRRRRSVAVADVMRGARDMLRHQATHDELTGLGNRRLFIEMAETQRLYQQDRGGAYAVLLVDLDDFKSVNDTLGHHSGDELLTAVSQRLHAVMRTNDLVARIGGDEFAILVTDVRGSATPALVATRILAALHAPVTICDLPLSVRASIGIAVSAPHDGDGELLLRWADAAMYEAKRQGNTFVVYDPTTQMMDSKKPAPLFDESLSGL